MEKLKLIIFIEALAMLVCGVGQFAAFITKVDFPLDIYPVMAGIVLVAMLFTIWVLAPIFEWFMKF